MSETVSSSDKSEAPPWIERTVGDLLRLMGGTIATFLRLLYLPWQAPNVAVAKKPTAPPLSFLIVCVLLTGVITETFVLYFGRPVDEGLTSLLANAIAELGPTEITLLTLPIVALVVIAGAVTAWWTVKTSSVFENPVVRGVCYAAGVQAMILAVFFLALLISKWIRTHDEVANSYLEPIPLLILLAILICSAAFQIERVIAKHGDTWVARHFVFRVPLAFGTSWTVFLGTLIVGSMSFDLDEAIDKNDRHLRIAELQELADELGEDKRLFIDEIRSKQIDIGDGATHIQQLVSLSNVSDKPLLVPRPDELQPSPVLAKLCDEPAPLESCSVDWTGDAGWVVHPGETRLVEWTIAIPDKITQESTQLPLVSLLVEFVEVDVEYGQRHFESPLGRFSNAHFDFELHRANDLETAADQATEVTR